MYRIVIADDEKFIRDGLARLNWDAHGMEVVGVARNGVEARELIDSLTFDVLLTDIKMPGEDGLQLAEKLKRTNPAAKTILLSGYSEFAYAQQAISTGVFSYILKPSTPEEIFKLVQAACEEIEKERQKTSTLSEMRSRLEGYEDVLGAKQVLRNEQETGISDILRYIYANYEKNLTLSDLAGEFFFSTVYLSGYIKRYTGHTFLEILTSVRMYHAARLLKETRLRNGEIGQRIGIADERYFGQVFKKTFGQTPYEYRKSNATPQTSIEEFVRTGNEGSR